MAISDYLNKLVELKNSLVANLNTMGVSASESEKLNTLVPKVLEINSTSGFTAYKCPVYFNDTGSNTGATNTYSKSVYIDISSIPDYDNLVLDENAFVILNPIGVSIVGNTSLKTQNSTFEYKLVKDGNSIKVTVQPDSTNNQFYVHKQQNGINIQSDSRFLAMVYVFN